MANRYAVASASGLLSSTWDGGTLPGPTDDLFANGFTVSYAASSIITALSLRTESASGISAGGGFSLGAGCTVNADLRAGTSIVLNGPTNLTLNGHSYAGSGSNIYGIITGTGCTINGDSFGGSGGNAAGIYLRWGSIQFGKSNGGSGAGSAVGTMCDMGGIHSGECKASATNRGTWLRNGAYFFGTIDNTVNAFAMYCENSLAIINGVSGSAASTPISSGGAPMTIILRNNLPSSLVSGSFLSTLARYPFVNLNFGSANFTGGLSA